MDFRIRNKVTTVVGLWTSFVSMLPGTLASSETESHSIATVVLLLLLLFVLIAALVLAWKRLITTEGGEAYHPWELWQRAQDMVQDVKNQWTKEEGDEASTAEDQHDEEEDQHDEEEDQHDEAEPDITSL